MFSVIEKRYEQTRGSLDPVQAVADLPIPKLPWLLSLLSPAAGSAVNSNQYKNSFHIEKRDAVQNIIILYVNTFSFFKEFFYKLYMLCKVRSFPVAWRPSHWVLSFVSSSWMAKSSQMWFLQIIQPGWFLPSHFLSLLLTQHTPSTATFSSNASIQ